MAKAQSGKNPHEDLKAIGDRLVMLRKTLMHDEDENQVKPDTALSQEKAAEISQEEHVARDSIKTEEGLLRGNIEAKRKDISSNDISDSVRWIGSRISEIEKLLGEINSAPSLTSSSAMAAGTDRTESIVQQIEMLEREYQRLMRIQDENDRRTRTDTQQPVLTKEEKQRLRSGLQKQASKAADVAINKMKLKLDEERETLGDLNKTLSEYKDQEKQLIGERHKLDIEIRKLEKKKGEESSAHKKSANYIETIQSRLAQCQEDLSNNKQRIEDLRGKIVLKTQEIKQSTQLVKESQRAYEAMRKQKDRVVKEAVDAKMQDNPGSDGDIALSKLVHEAFYEVINGRFKNGEELKYAKILGVSAAAVAGVGGVAAVIGNYQGILSGVATAFSHLKNDGVEKQCAALVITAAALIVGSFGVSKGKKIYGVIARKIADYNYAMKEQALMKSNEERLEKMERGELVGDASDTSKSQPLKREKVAVVGGVVVAAVIAPEVIKMLCNTAVDIIRNFEPDIPKTIASAIATIVIPAALYVGKEKFYYVIEKVRDWVPETTKGKVVAGTLTVVGTAIPVIRHMATLAPSAAAGPSAVATAATSLVRTEGFISSIGGVVTSAAAMAAGPVAAVLGTMALASLLGRTGFFDKNKFTKALKILGSGIGPAAVISGVVNKLFPETIRISGAVAPVMDELIGVTGPTGALLLAGAAIGMGVPALKAAYDKAIAIAARGGQSSSARSSSSSPEATQDDQTQAMEPGQYVGQSETSEPPGPLLRSADNIEGIEGAGVPTEGERSVSSSSNKFEVQRPERSRLTRAFLPLKTPNKEDILRMCSGLAHLSGSLKDAGIKYLAEHIFAKILLQYAYGAQKIEKIESIINNNFTKLGISLAAGVVAGATITPEMIEKAIMLSADSIRKIDSTIPHQLVVGIVTIVASTLILMGAEKLAPAKLKKMTDKVGQFVAQHKIAATLGAAIPLGVLVGYMSGLAPTLSTEDLKAKLGAFTESEGFTQAVAFMSTQAGPAIAAALAGSVAGPVVAFAVTLMLSAVTGALGYQKITKGAFLQNISTGITVVKILQFTFNMAVPGSRFAAPAVDALAKLVGPSLVPLVGGVIAGVGITALKAITNTLGKLRATRASKTWSPSPAPAATKKEKAVRVAAVAALGLSAKALLDAEKKWISGAIGFLRALPTDHPNLTSSLAIAAITAGASLYAYFGPKKAKSIINKVGIIATTTGFVAYQGVLKAEVIENMLDPIIKILQGVGGRDNISDDVAKGLAASLVTLIAVDLLSALPNIVASISRMGVEVAMFFNEDATLFQKVKAGLATPARLLFTPSVLISGALIVAQSYLNHPNTFSNPNTGLGEKAGLLIPTTTVMKQILVRMDILPERIITGIGTVLEMLPTMNDVGITTAAAGMAFFVLAPILTLVENGSEFRNKFVNAGAFGITTLFLTVAALSQHNPFSFDITKPLESSNITTALARFIREDNTGRAITIAALAVGIGTFGVIKLLDMAFTKWKGAEARYELVKDTIEYALELAQHENHAFPDTTPEEWGDFKKNKANWIAAMEKDRETCNPDRQQEYIFWKQKKEGIIPKDMKLEDYEEYRGKRAEHGLWELTAEDFLSFKAAVARKEADYDQDLESYARFKQAQREGTAFEYATFGDWKAFESDRKLGEVGSEEYVGGDTQIEYEYLKAQSKGELKDITYKEKKGIPPFRSNVDNTRQETLDEFAERKGKELEKAAEQQAAEQQAAAATKIQSVFRGRKTRVELAKKAAAQAVAPSSSSSSSTLPIPPTAPTEQVKQPAAPAAAPPVKAEDPTTTAPAAAEQRAAPPPTLPQPVQSDVSAAAAAEVPVVRSPEQPPTHTSVEPRAVPTASGPWAKKVTNEDLIQPQFRIK